MWEVTQIVEHQFLLIPGDLQSLLLPLPLPRPDLHCSVALCPQRIPVCLSNTLHPLPPSTIHVYFHLHIHVLRNPKRIVDWGMGIAECANCVSLMDLSLSLLKRKQCVSVLMITGYLFIFFLAPPSTYLLYPISHSLSTWIVSDIFFLLLLFIFYERHLSLFRFCSRCSSLFHFRFCLCLVLASFSLCCAIFLLVPPSLFFSLAAAFIFIFIIICAFLVPFVIIVFLFAVVVVVAVLDVSYFVFFVWYFVWFNHNSVEARQKASNQTQLSALLGNSFPLPLLLALSLPLPASSQQSKSSQHWTSVFRGHLYSSSSPASSACASEIARVCSCVCVCVLSFERFDSIRFHYDQHILPSL